MPITSTDLLFKYSVSGGPGNFNDQPNPNQSLGGYISDTLWLPGSGSLFNDQTTLNWTSGSISSGQVDYRCIFLHNNHPTLTLIRPVAWVAQVSGEAPGLGMIAIGADNTAPSPANSISGNPAQSLTVANAFTAPVGVSFIPASGGKQGLVLGNLPAGMCEAIWVQRTQVGSLASGNLSGSLSFTLRVMGDTMP